MCLFGGGDGLRDNMNIKTKIFLAFQKIYRLNNILNRLNLLDKRRNTQMIPIHSVMRKVD